MIKLMRGMWPISVTDRLVFSRACLRGGLLWHEIKAFAIGLSHYLAEQGAVEDSSGKATSVLKQGDRLRRNRRRLHTGRRRHGQGRFVDASDQRQAHVSDLPRWPTVPCAKCRFPGRGRQRARRAGLRRAGSRAAGPGRTRAAATPTDTSESASWARRRLEQLEARNATLQRDVARANAEAEAVAAERDISQNQLEAAQHNLSLLTDRLQEPRRPQGEGSRASRARRAVTAQPAAPSPSPAGPRPQSEPSRSILTGNPGLRDAVEHAGPDLDDRSVSIVSAARRARLSPFLSGDELGFVPGCRRS